MYLIIIIWLPPTDNQGMVSIGFVFVLFLVLLFLLTFFAFFLVWNIDHVAIKTRIRNRAQTIKFLGKTFSFQAMAIGYIKLAMLKIMIR